MGTLMRMDPKIVRSKARQSHTWTRTPEWRTKLKVFLCSCQIIFRIIKTKINFQQMVEATPADYNPDFHPLLLKWWQKYHPDNTLHTLCKIAVFRDSGKQVFPPKRDRVSITCELKLFLNGISCIWTHHNSLWFHWLPAILSEIESKVSTAIRCS